MRDLRATYRLQLTPEFGFAETRQLVPYLRDLGITHLYLSPSLQAREGSTHGYDVVDPRNISRALGGEAEFRALAGGELGVILDIVPNHMAAVDENPFWRDLQLREMFFDVDLKTGFHRRFFDVGELGGVKQEDWEVFWATHAKVIELVREGLVDGVRVDHPDGLADPAQYFERLRDAGVEHVWAEKIVEPGEELRDWPIEGTTGYEFLNEVMGIFVDPDAEAVLTTLYEEVTGDSRRFDDIAALSKLEVAVNLFEPELRRLHQELEVESLPLALASFHVYRTYIRPHEAAIDDADRDEIGRAGVSEKLRRLLFLQEEGHEEFVVRFQQTTGPVMAKGVEDTAFYRYFRLAALNEVGGSPGRFGVSIHEFHEANLKRARRFPRHLLTTYTHDTKRSPDVRARIVRSRGSPTSGRAACTLGVPSSAPSRIPAKSSSSCRRLWGRFRSRASAWTVTSEKALREGKVTTDWLAPNIEHEARVQEYAARAAELVGRDPFLDRVRVLGRQIALGQLLLKLTAPGVPDVYQGDELEGLSLVDPDNRRPVDWGIRRTALADLRAGVKPTVETEKLYVTWKALGVRAAHPAAFAASYQPIDLGAGICAYTRGSQVLVAVATRPDVSVRVPHDWRDVLGLAGLALGVRR